MYHYNIMNMLQVCLKCVLSKAGNWMWNKVPITIAKQLTAIKTYKSRYKYHSHKSSYNPGHLAHLKKKTTAYWWTYCHSIQWGSASQAPISCSLVLDWALTVDVQCIYRDDRPVIINVWLQMSYLSCRSQVRIMDHLKTGEQRQSLLGSCPDGWEEESSGTRGVR